MHNNALIYVTWQYISVHYSEIRLQEYELGVVKYNSTSEKVILIKSKLGVKSKVPSPISCSYIKSICFEALLVIDLLDFLSCNLTVCGFNNYKSKYRTLPLYQRHMVGASMQVILVPFFFFFFFWFNLVHLAFESGTYLSFLLQLQQAAKLLDTGAVRATRFFWRYPTARVILLFYLVSSYQP